MSRADVSHVTYHLTSLWSVALLSVKLSRRGIFVPAPAVSHVWVNPPSLEMQVQGLLSSVGSVYMDLPAGFEEGSCLSSPIRSLFVD
ncbi:hypothetical protein KEJ15_02680 [Candidatus Bathyarchaeota archaeon]|nr:hypothetical protein [Candidatus Bathyarchaeota archaeon]